MGKHGTRNYRVRNWFQIKFQILIRGDSVIIKRMRWESIVLKVESYSKHPVTFQTHTIKTEDYCLLIFAIITLGS